MKKIRKIACLFLALAMMLSLAACDSFEVKMTRAAKKMEKLQSYRMDMDIDMQMSMSLLGQSMPLDLGIKGTTDVDSKSDRTKTEFDMNMLGETVHLLSYTEKDGERLVGYVSQDGGETWIKQSAERAEAAQISAKDKLGMLLKLAKSFEKSGTETVRGSEATVFSGVIQGEEIAAAVEMSGVLDSLKESMDIDLADADIDLSQCGSIPATIAIDNKSGMITRYTMDLTEVMQHLMPTLLDRALSSVSEQLGLEGLDLSALGFEAEIGRVFTAAELYDFDAVGTIEIPDAARAAEEAQIAA